MMRSISLSALLFAGAFFATACEGPETTDLIEVEPSYGSVVTECEALQVLVEVEGEPVAKSELLGSIHDLIDDLFETRASINGAKSHIDNTARKVCDGDWALAEKMAWAFFLQVDQQLDGQPAKRESPYVDYAGSLLTMTFALVWEPDTPAPPVIPDGAFRDNGGIGVVSTRKGGTIFSHNFEAAAVVDPDDYPSGNEVYIALSRTFDSKLKIPGFNTVVPAGYWIMASDNPQDNHVDDGVLVQMCILEPEGGFPTGFLNRLQLAHDQEDQTELLDPVRGADLSIDCSGVAPYGSTDQASASNWLQSLGRFAGATFQRFFGPEPLRAWRAGGTGLGGRTKSFSPIAPVDPLSSLSISIEPAESTIVVGETVQLTATLHDPFDLVPPNPEFTWSSADISIATVDGGGVVRGEDGGTTTITATLNAPDLLPTGVVVSGEAQITVMPLLVLEVYLENQADMSKEFRVSWEPSFGDPTECSADPRTANTCYPEFPANQEVTFTAEALWPTLPNSNVPGFDIWITPGGAGCSPHQQGSGVATCVFTMPSEEPFKIEFRQTNGGGD